VGIIYLKANVLVYLLPPCEVSRKHFSSSTKHMLGIFVDSNRLPREPSVAKVSVPPPAQAQARVEAANKIEARSSVAPQQKSSLKSASVPRCSDGPSGPYAANGSVVASAQTQSMAPLMSNPELDALLADPTIQRLLTATK
jgi:hypothetical protein